MKETALVTGGAGYIGSAAAKALLEKGYNVIVADNLSNGVLSIVDKRAKFYKADLADKDALGKIFEKEKISFVMHFAAYKLVEESMKDAVKYSDNIKGTINLLNLMVKHKVSKIVFSSSAAVYGEVQYSPIDEKHPTAPCNFYGQTKLECERLIEWYSKIYGIKFVFLRYFNVAGDYGLNYIDPNPKNILPVIMEVIFKKREKLMIYGNDYETSDGTCIRDYIDINDLVRAHIMAIRLKNESINLGTSKGFSNLEIVRAAEEATGREVPFIYAEKRLGDPAVLVASTEKAKKILGWEPQKGIKDMIKSMFEAYKSHF